MPKLKPVPFPQRWETEISALHLGEESTRRVRRLAAVLHTAMQLQEQVSRNRRTTKKLTNLQQIAYFYFAHCYEMGQAAYDLAKLKYGPAIVVLVRTLLESTIDLAYLWLCVDINGNGADDREAWIDHHHVTRAQIDTMSKEMGRRREVAGLPIPSNGFDGHESAAYQFEADSFKERYRRTEWPKVSSLRDRAYKVDLERKLFRATGALLEDDYILAYKWSSQAVHGNVGAAHMYIRDTESEWQVDFSPSEPYLGVGVAMATRFLVQVLYMVDHIAHLNGNLEAQLKASGYMRP